MTRRECLDAAAECVLKDRAAEYGKVENNFKRIADLWEAYLHAPISALDVAMMMALLKVARAKANPSHADSFVDLAGYAACGAELAGAEKAREDDIRRLGEEYRRLRAKAEGDAKAEDCEEPKFKPGDKVQVRSLCTGKWEDAVCLHPIDGGFAVKTKDCEKKGVFFHDLRPAPKVEGVEALVVSPFDEERQRKFMPGIVPQDGPSDFDAPQTKDALFRHIVDCNPSTFGCVRTPMGEELAEMAEEGGNG